MYVSVLVLPQETACPLCKVYVLCINEIVRCPNGFKVFNKQQGRWVSVSSENNDRNICMKIYKSPHTEKYVS